jgi:adenine-specific DNA-methyltransferase
MRKNMLNLEKECNLILGDALKKVDIIPPNSIDLTITSPPYFMGKEYDTSNEIDGFVSSHTELLPKIVEKTKAGGSICWQVGYHVDNDSIKPLDYIVYDIMSKISGVYLKNRIIWTFGHGLHNKKRFSGRHEMILWFTKGKEYNFDLEPVRVPQKYPGKKFYKGENKGEFSGNPNGKNPSDVWEIPNVKANHIEKTEHPCQFPIALAQRLIKALCPPDGTVFDPYMGSGSTGAAALIEKRKFIGIELNAKYYAICIQRLQDAKENKLRYRPFDKPILVPSPNTAVASKPSTFNY